MPKSPFGGTSTNRGEAGPDAPGPTDEIGHHADAVAGLIHPGPTEATAQPRKMAPVGFRTGFVTRFRNGFRTGFRTFCRPPARTVPGEDVPEVVTRLPNLSSKLRSPLDRTVYFRRIVALARRISRSSSRLRMSCRLSYSALPLQTPSETLTRSPFQ